MFFHRMLKIYRRFKMAARTGEFFALHQWDFISKNIQELNKDVSFADRRTFPIDITQVVWDTYVKDYVFGIRNYVLKDPPSTIPQALSKLQRYKWRKLFFFNIYNITTHKNGINKLPLKTILYNNTSMFCFISDFIGCIGWHNARLLE